ncbi:MAG: ECF transporter S component [Proteobacteria bacterium]|nr:ECF transporter S component [Pseudomonadota bacterium]
METKTLALNAYDYKNVKTYLAATAFVIGNVVLPQLCHLLPFGGRALLPIYFFTLIAAWRFGWLAGLLTAMLSPVVNALLFGMPTVEMLPVLLVKSGLLAIAASWAAQKTQRVSVAALAGVVLFYQMVGSAIAWPILGDFFMAFRDFKIAIPGMLLQVAGGWLILKNIFKNQPDTQS